MATIIGGREVALSKALPLTLGDFRALKREHGIDQNGLAAGDVETIAKLVLYLAKKVDPTVTETEVDAISMTDIPAMIASIGEKQGELDRPT